MTDVKLSTNKSMPQRIADRLKGSGHPSASFRDETRRRTHANDHVHP
jgi:hypothetical protein